MAEIEIGAGSVENIITDPEEPGSLQNIIDAILQSGNGGDNVQNLGTVPTAGGGGGTTQGAAIAVHDHSGHLTGGATLNPSNWADSTLGDVSTSRHGLVPKLTASNASVAFVPLTAPLTSTSWDGDAYSTTAKTLIDLSAVFGVPAGVKAVDAMVLLRDSGSAANDTWLILSPNNTANQGKFFDSSGLTNDMWERGSQKIPCDSNGDIYYQINASGAGTMDVHIQIWGYDL